MTRKSLRNTLNDRRTVCASGNGASTEGERFGPGEDEDASDRDRLHAQPISAT